MPLISIPSHFQITAGNGELLGTLEQEWSVLVPVFRVKDAHGKLALRIKGPIFTFSCCGSDVEFKAGNNYSFRILYLISKQFICCCR